MKNTWKSTPANANVISGRGSDSEKPSVGPTQPLEQQWLISAGPIHKARKVMSAESRLSCRVSALLCSVRRFRYDCGLRTCKRLRTCNCTSSQTYLKASEVLYRPEGSDTTNEELER
ncbi:hypothetical protein NDU88_001449 [Pleurodeles waltl]|uniref:Uncharacterized protein n=1 Tax=Pleurodeles waltl TaxID=8319 RepID=A0AAV7UWU3_PLEWA|nr:hypothetical protein NDU88_001449 [Pleurodeles waltl]